MNTPTPTAEQGPTVSDIPGTPEFAEKHPITSKAHLQFMLWVLKDEPVTTEQKLAHMLQKPANGWQVSAALERRNAELAEALDGAAFSYQKQDRRDMLGPDFEVVTTDFARTLELRAVEAERRCGELEALLRDYREWMTQVESRREGAHRTFNGGHHEKETNDAFHHGMDTIYNVLKAHGERTIPVITAALTPKPEPKGETE